MTSFTLTNIGWVDLGQGPMVVRLNSGNGAYLSVGASAPSWGASGSPIGVSSGDPTSASLSETSHVWARAATISGAQVNLTTFIAGQGGSPPPSIGVDTGGLGSASAPLSVVSALSAPVALTPSDSITFTQLKTGVHIDATVPGNIKVGWPNGTTATVYFGAAGPYDRAWLINQIFVTGTTATFTAIGQ